MDVATVVVHPPNGSVTEQSGASQFPGGAARQDAIDVIKRIVAVGSIVKAVIVVVPEGGQIKVVTGSGIGMSRPVENDLGNRVTLEFEVALFDRRIVPLAESFHLVAVHLKMAVILIADFHIGGSPCFARHDQRSGPVVAGTLEFDGGKFELSVDIGTTDPDTSGINGSFT